MSPISTMEVMMVGDGLVDTSSGDVAKVLKMLYSDSRGEGGLWKRCFSLSRGKRRAGFHSLLQLGDDTEIYIVLEH